MQINDQAARQQALDATASFIVQAPAGSGKTELLTQRFLVLLSQVQQPEEIIAITFTRKAAGEMRQRIIKALSLSQGPEPEAAHAKLTWGLAKSALAQSERQAWHLLDNPNRLQIQTIDALCSTITRQMPILARFGAQPSVSDAPDKFYRAAAREVLKGLDADSPWSAALKIVLLHLDNQFERAENLFVSMLACRDQWLPHIIRAHHQEDLRSQLDSALTDIVRDNLAPLSDLFDDEQKDEFLKCVKYAALNLDADGKNSPLGELIELGALPGADVDNLSLWQSLSDFLLRKDNGWRKSFTKNQGFPAPSSTKDAEEKRVYKDYKDKIGYLIESLQDNPRLLNQLIAVKRCPAPQYSNAQWQVVEALLSLLRVLTAQLHVLFSQYGSVDFSEIAMAALAALGDEDNPSDIALALDHHIQHLLIDEFQDTSISQFRLLEKLIAGWQCDDGRSLFLVGDPMQSIYRFRQAEVGLFLRAQQEGLTTRDLMPLHLSTNFRSDPCIVNWVNDKFSKCFPDVADYHQGAVPYSFADSVHEAAAHAVVACHATVSRQQEAQDLVALIEETQSNQPAASMAILVKARQHLLEILPLLQAHNIPYQAVELDALHTRPVIQDLFSLTRAVLYPADRLAWLSILRAPWCGLSLSDLHHISQRYPDGSLAAICFDDTEFELSDSQLLRLKKVSATLKETYEQRSRWSLRDSLYRTWCQLGGPACLESDTAIQDAKAYFDLLEQFEKGGALEDIDEFETQLNRLFASSDPNSSKQLQIMTIHKSKGLEFDVVMLPGLDRGSRRSDNALLMWSERPCEHDDSALILAPIKASQENDDPIYNYLRFEDNSKSEHELARLLYVAVTRAKYQLHCFFTVSRNSDGELKEPIGSSLLKPLWPYIQSEFAIPNAPADDIEDDDNDHTLQRLSLNYSDNARFPGLDFENQGSNPMPDDRYRWQSQHARRIGTLTHRVLQQIAESGELAFDCEAHYPQWRQQLLSAGCGLSEIESAITTMTSAINHCLSDERGRWILSSAHRDAACELALSTQRKNKIDNIIIDRTFIDANQKRWIIDYKIAKPEDESLTDFLKTQKERYLPQLNHYAAVFKKQNKEVIHCGLYFPLVPAWLEWEF